MLQYRNCLFDLFVQFRHDYGIELELAQALEEAVRALSGTSMIMGGLAIYSVGIS